MRKLNPDQQECIQLRFLQGLSVAETAEIMRRYNDVFQRHDDVGVNQVDGARVCRCEAKILERRGIVTHLDIQNLDVQRRLATRRAQTRRLAERARAPVARVRAPARS